MYRGLYVLHVEYFTLRTLHVRCTTIIQYCTVTVPVLQYMQYYTELLCNVQYLLYTVHTYCTLYSTLNTVYSTSSEGIQPKNAVSGLAFAGVWCISAAAVFTVCC